jgi:hypothetical protein
MLGHNNMKFRLNTKATRMYLKRWMLTPYKNIDHMIARLTWKTVHNPHLDPFTTYHKMNLQHSEYTLMKTSKKVSFDIPNWQLLLWSCLSRRRMDPFECVLKLPLAKLTHHQEPILATFDLRIIGSTKSSQGVH